MGVRIASCCTAQSLEATSEVRHALADLLIRVRVLAPSLSLGLPPASEVHLATNPVDAAHQVDARGGARVEARVEMTQQLVQGLPQLAGGNGWPPAVGGLLRQAVDEDRVGMVRF